MKIHRFQTALAVLALGVAFAGPSAASVISCEDASAQGFTTDGTAKVHDGSNERLTAASGCQIATPITGTTPPLTADPGDVNEVGFFGISDWVVEVEKVELPDPDTQPGNGQSGTWAITDANFTDFFYMITFKDGGSTNLVSFLFNGLFDEGGWNTPFTNPPFSASGEGSRDVSHYTIFASEKELPPKPPQVIPEPAPVALFGAGLLALVWIRRRWLMS